MQEVFSKIIEKLEELQNYACFPTEWVNEEQSKIHSYYANKLTEILKLTEQYNSGWIPCSERLPEPIRPVLVTLRNWMNDKYIVRVGRFHTDHWKTDEGIVENSVVIAWQPLPQPYQTKGE